MASSRSRTRSCTYPGRSTPVTAISVLLVPSALEAVGEKFRHNSVKAGHALNLNPVPAFAEHVQVSTPPPPPPPPAPPQPNNLIAPAMQHQHLVLQRSNVFFAACQHRDIGLLVRDAKGPLLQFLCTRYPN